MTCGGQVAQDSTVRDLWTRLVVDDQTGECGGCSWGNSNEALGEFRQISEEQRRETPGGRPNYAKDSPGVTRVSVALCVVARTTPESANLRLWSWGSQLAQDAHLESCLRPQLRLSKMVNLVMTSGRAGQTIHAHTSRCAVTVSSVGLLAVESVCGFGPHKGAGSATCNAQRSSELGFWVKKKGVLSHT